MTAFRLAMLPTSVPLALAISGCPCLIGCVRQPPQVERVAHVPAPAEYATLTNPFESPQSCVVLEQVGANAEAVRDVVQSAVEHRTAEWSNQLLTDLPRVVRESADPEAAAELAGRLGAAGAKCSVRDSLDVFVEWIASDLATPIGRPSEVLDVRRLESGRNAIAQLREQIAAAGAAAVDRTLAREAFLAFKTAEGRALYQTNCRPCHGTKGSGDGPMAAGLSLAPANFRDPLSIASLAPGEVLWRVEQGGPGLPPEATPWDSAMPAWRHEIDREMAWKIILGTFSTANVQPRSGPPRDHAHGQQPAERRAAPRVPEESWLEWPIPPKPADDAASRPEFVERGRYIYFYRCMPCHGVSGACDGPAAHTTWPRPRDFTDVKMEGFDEPTPPKFKFRSTERGWLPTDEDLYRTIGRGLVGTAMEGWSDVLQPDDIWQVIAYIKTLSKAWDDPEHIALNPNDPVVVKEYTEPGKPGPIRDFAAMVPPPVTPALIQDGESAFRRAGCWECHGVEARGDGPALGQHYDSWGYRTWPQNLTSAFNYKAGHSLRDIYRDFTAGFDGTVMPTLPAAVLDPDPQRGEQLLWAVAAHVHSQVASEPSLNGPSVIEVRRSRGELPLDPLDARWQRARETIVPLSGQLVVAPRWQAPSVNQVAIRAVFNDGSLAIWLRWNDRRPNVTHSDPPTDLEPADPRPLGPKTYTAAALKPKAPVVFDARDQIELQVPTTLSASVDKPFLLYGDEKNPVTLWRWLADRQGLTVTKRVVRIGGAQAERLECSSTSAEASESAVVTLRAAGAKTPPELSGGERVVRSRASWSNGAWTLVLAIDGFPPAANDEIEAIPLAVHVWDGLGGETDLRMAMSSWVYLSFRRPLSFWHVLVVASVVAVAVMAAVAVVRFRRRRSERAHA